MTFENDRMKAAFMILAVALFALGGCQTIPQPTSVTVSGQVAKPGTYTLPDGSTVQDAVDAAGGVHGYRTFYNPHDAVITRADGSEIKVRVKDWSSTVISPGDEVAVPRYWF